MSESVNGWFKPSTALAKFLEEYSRAGGMHHAVLCYADCIDAMISFASAMDFTCVVID
jgi:L-arabinose isomerase